MSETELKLYSNSFLKSDKLNNIKKLDIIDDSSEDLNEIFNNELNNSDISIEINNKEEEKVLHNQVKILN